MTIQQDLIQPSLGAWVDLHCLDATAQGMGAPFYFTDATASGSDVSFGGQAYTPIPITSAGFQASSEGALPRPTITISNVNKFIQPYVLAHNYFQGAKYTRTRTLSQYLDSGATPDSTQYMPLQVWYIDMIVSMTKQHITFGLVSPLDRPGMMIPARQILRDNGFPGAGFPYLT